MAGPVRRVQTVPDRPTFTFQGGAPGLVPISDGVNPTTEYLRKDGTWAVPAGGGGGGGGLSDGDYGDVIVSGGGTVISLDADVVGPTELADTAVTPGTYSNATVTVDAQGRITSITEGSSMRYDSGIYTGHGSSSAAFATKGCIITPVSDIDVYGLVPRITLVAGATYRARVYKISGSTTTATVTEIVDEGVDYIPSASETGAVKRIPFSVPFVTLEEGVTYALCISRVDAAVTDTHALPIWAGTSAGAKYVIFPVCEHNIATRWAKKAPAVGDASSGIAGSTEIGILFDNVVIT